MVKICPHSPGFQILRSTEKMICQYDTGGQIHHRCRVHVPRHFLTILEAFAKDPSLTRSIQSV